MLDLESRLKLLDEELNKVTPKQLHEELIGYESKGTLAMDFVFIGSHQEWRRTKTKVGSRRVKYVVVTCNLYVHKKELKSK